LNEWFLYKKINGTLKIEEVPTWIQSQYIISQSKKILEPVSKKEKFIALKKFEGREKFQRFFV
jgi:hypothetical protein